MGTLTNIARLILALYFAYAARNGPFENGTKQVLWAASLVTVTVVIIAEVVAITRFIMTGL